MDMVLVFLGVVGLFCINLMIRDAGHIRPLVGAGVQELEPLLTVSVYKRSQQYVHGGAPT
jgi:hypothetical protein